MSAALKGRDWSPHFKGNNPSFPLGLHWEGLMREEKQLWLSACFRHNFTSLPSWSVRGSPTFCSASECLGSQCPSLPGAGASWEFVFAGTSAGSPLGQSCAGCSLQDLGFHQEGCHRSAGVALIIFSSKTKSSCLTWQFLYSQILRRDDDLKRSFKRL